jgi:CPA2 family monovalent cation:H+ antiporter-2
MRTLVILTAKELNPELRVFVRARYVRERIWLEEVGATGISNEEGETAIGLAVLLQREVRADEDHIRKETNKIRKELAQIGGN